MDFSPESTLRDCGGETVADDKIIPQLREFLSIEAWARRDIPEPEKLLGSLVTKTTRLFLVGSTGLGKTMFGFAIAEGIASGQGFLHWRSARAARVLYIDGEMASDLIKSRSIEIRNAGDIFDRFRGENRRHLPEPGPDAATEYRRGALVHVAPGRRHRRRRRRHF
jgi:hypothetical protein